MAFKVHLFVLKKKKKRIVEKTGPILYSEACIKLVPLSVYLQLLVKTMLTLYLNQIKTFW